MQDEKLTLICEYEDFSIFKHKIIGLLYCLRADSDEFKEVLEVYRVPNWEEVSTDDSLDDTDIINMCPVDYDYSGELDDLSAYCFWQVIENIDFEGEN